MGSGKQVFNYLEAAQELLKRSYPDIFNGTQVGPVFIPETLLPSYTRAVVHRNFEEKLNQYYVSQNPKENGENLIKDQEFNKFKGVHAERIFHEECQRILQMRGSKVVVLEGFQMMLPEILRKPGAQAGGRQESDFLIINQEYLYIMSLEVKYNLHAIPHGNREASIQKGLSQISQIKTILETFFSNDIDISKWRFVGVLGSWICGDE